MLKKILLVLAVLALLSSAALSEQGAPQLIEAQEDQRAAMQIRSLDGSHTVRILGVESQPQQRRWEEFSTVFTSFVKKNWDVDVQFSDAIWSNGRWLHLLDMGPVILRVDTTDGTPDGLIREVLLTGFQKEYTGDVQVLAGAAFWAAAQYGDYGKYTMQIVFMEDHSEDWFTEEPMPVWLENGYQLTFGLTEMGCPCGRIAFSEELPTLGGYEPLDVDGLENIQSDQTVEELFKKLEAAASDGPLGGLLTVPRLPKEWQEMEGGRMYQIVWDDCALLLYTDGEGQHLLSATLSCMSGDTVSACVHLYSLYAAVAGLADDALVLLSDIVGGSGTWPDMCALSPYCVINGVLLQCDVQAIGGEELPVAFICGAREKE